MKLEKLTKKLSDFFNLEKRKQKEQIEQLKIILRKLSKKAHKIQVKKEDEKDQVKLSRYEKELEIIHTQRLKGLERLKTLRSI
ncbi:MAG: hypothetical protein GY696_17915 [Gammaproteobacteria bacterium]|nr:hypothetical protein [Gammaproteobacteria bacterium]